MEPFVTGAIVTVSYVVVVSLIGALKLIRRKEEGSQSTVHTKMHVWPTSSDYQEGGAARYRLEETRDLESLQEDIRKMEEGLTKRKEAESGGPEAKRKFEPCNTFNGLPLSSTSTSRSFKSRSYNLCSS